MPEEKTQPAVSPSEATPTAPTPSEPGAALEKPSVVPEEKTQPAVSPSEATPTAPTPSEPTAAPDEPSASPDEPGAAPEKPSVTRAEPQAAPAEPHAAPTKPTAAPEEKTQPAVSPSEATPTAPTPSEPGAAPDEPGAAPEKPIVTRAEPQAAPAEPHAAPTKPSVIPGKPGVVPGKPGVVPGKPGGAAPPVPRPTAHASETAIPVVEPVVTPVDPSQWGRIDADGVVYVRTSTGERVVGDWQAGGMESGLEHFGRRFDDFVVEIAVLEARLASGSGDAKSARSQAVQLRESTDTLAAIGDFAAAAERLDAVIAHAATAIEQAAAHRAEARAQAVKDKESLCEEAEKLGSSTQWKAAGDRLKMIVTEWRAIRGIDRKTDDALWKRFARARDTFTRARGAHFAELDKQRLVAKDVKEKLIKRAEALSTSREWRDTSAAYRDLMTEWKAAGRAPRDVEEDLWGRFRAAQDAFFTRRNEVFAERDAEFDANAQVKEKLLKEAEHIKPSADLEDAKRKLRSLQERWEAAGKVPRDRMHELDGKLHEVEEKVRQANDAEWKRSDPEATARLEQFRVRAEQFREQAAKARAAGNERKAAEAEEQAATWEQWLATAENAVDG